MLCVLDGFLVCRLEEREDESLGFEDEDGVGCQSREIEQQVDDPNRHSNRVVSNMLDWVDRKEGT